MSVEYTSIRIERSLAARLNAYRERLEARKNPEQRLGRSATSVSLAEAIETLLDQKDAHRERAKKSAANKARKDLEGQQVFDVCK